MRNGYDALRRFTTEHIADYDLEVDGFKLRLRRVGKPKQQPVKAALLVHGANSGSATFMVPDGGLARYLMECGWDVWLLDWRGSPYVIRDLERRRLDRTQLEVERRRFAFERAATDVARGLDFVRAEVGEQACLSVLGHCVGGGITSVALAEGLIDGKVENIVLGALGLFFEVPWDGWTKAEDFILERVLAEDASCRTIDPHGRTPWPPPMEAAYRRWPEAWQVEPHRREAQLLNRLSFMVGKPWSPELIDSSIDADVLEEVFGGLHIGLYLHCGQNVRRGFSARLGELDVLERSRLGTCSREDRARDHLRPEGFRNRNITLAIAGQNRVWHRDAMDHMYEWLLAEARPTRVTKLVFPGYGLQELYWGKRARRETYPSLERGLAGTHP